MIVKNYPEIYIQGKKEKKQASDLELPDLFIHVWISDAVQL